MRTFLTVALWLAAGPAVLSSQDAVPATHPLRIAFVGDADSPRTRAFAGFLRERFAEVAVVARDSADPEALAAHDVVLLDWPQSDRARAQRAAGWSPLGPRADWRTPAVLLGSAGLNLAGAWEVRGGFG